MYRSTNGHAASLIRDIEKTNEECEYFPVKPVRKKSYYMQAHFMCWHDNPCRSYQRSWKRHRKTQYKANRN